MPVVARLRVYIVSHFELYELDFISFKVHKVRTSQLWFSGLSVCMHAKQLWKLWAIFDQLLRRGWTRPKKKWVNFAGNPDSFTDSESSRILYEKTVCSPGGCTILVGGLRALIADSTCSWWLIKRSPEWVDLTVRVWFRVGQTDRRCWDNDRRVQCANGDHRRRRRLKPWEPNFPFLVYHSPFHSVFPTFSTLPILLFFFLPASLHAGLTS